MFGLITMIGGYLDADMQYDEVSEKLREYRHHHLPKKKIFWPIIEQSDQNEEDSDFDEKPPLRHPEDNKVFNKVSARVNRRIQYFTRENSWISHYPLVIIKEAI